VPGELGSPTVNNHHREVRGGDVVVNTPKRFRRFAPGVTGASGGGEGVRWVAISVIRGGRLGKKIRMVEVKKLSRGGRKTNPYSMNEDWCAGEQGDE